MFGLTINRVLVLTVVASLSCPVISFSPSLPASVSAHKQLPSSEDTFLWSRSKIPRELKTKLGGTKKNIRRALRDVFGCPPPWWPLFPGASPDNLQLLHVCVAHRSGFTGRTKPKLVDINLRDIITLTNEEETAILRNLVENNGPYQPQSSRMNVALRANISALIKGVGGLLGISQKRIVDVWGLRRSEQQLSIEGVRLLQDILQRDAEGDKVILRQMRLVTGNEGLNKIIIVTGLITANLAAEAGIANEVGIGVTNVPEVINGEFNIEGNANLRIMSRNKVLLAKFTGWHYKYNVPLAGKNLDKGKVSGMH